MAGYVRYISERLVICLLTIAISVTIVFFAPRMIPGDPLGAVLIKLNQMGSNRGGEAIVAEYTRRFGLDKSPAEQYVIYLGQLAQGNLGYSISSFPSTVSDLLKQAIPWTVGLLLVTTLISWTLGSLASREMLSTAIRKLGYEGFDDNAADALWLREMGLAHLERRTVTEYQREALAKVQWPALSMGATA